MINAEMTSDASEMLTQLRRIPGLEARIGVLEDRCERLFSVATNLHNVATSTESGVGVEITPSAWETFSHDLGVLWRERTGEHIVEDAGIFLDG